MQDLTGEIAIVSIATIFLLLISGAPILFLFMHRRQYIRYLTEQEQTRNLHQRELLQSQLEIQNQTLQQVGHDLHDNIGQLLTVTLMRLNALEDETEHSDLQPSIQQTRDLVNSIITEVRALSKTLDHDTVNRFGLLPSLQFELDRIQRVGKIQTQLIPLGNSYSLGEQVETVLLRMTQESLNNALKHARARTIKIRAEYKPDKFLLSIADDGRGFQVDEVMNRPLTEAGAGLNNLYRRAGLFGGDCQIISQPGVGTRIEISMPRIQPI
ncbi:sensor histidine kinase [Spirosoma aerolatum]|uniref:sensor histidine kinase n=1 Tax=Spirosoma aerolatum TaxID=1211326 RepID=UPI0009ADE875|nr:ATP-binding protein [Spirosoma aerolatum]